MRSEVVRVMCSRVFIGDSAWRPEALDLALAALYVGERPLHWWKLDPRAVVAEMQAAMWIVAKDVGATREGDPLYVLVAGKKNRS